MAADDNADRAYKASRRAEVEANLDAIFEETLREYADEADTQESAAGTEDPAAAPAASAPQQPPSAPAAPAAGPDKKSPRSVGDLVSGSEGEGPGLAGTAADVVAGIGRGIPKFAADVADNMSGLLHETADYFGLPDVNKNPRGGYRDLANETLGTPETGWGRFAEDATGEVAALVPVLRGIKSAGMLRGAGQLFAADFAVTALGSNKGDQTLSGQAAELAGVDNWFTDIIKNNPDDSTAERMIRTGLEGAFIGKAFDKAVESFQYARSWIKGRQAREAIAANSGEVLDEGVETAAATVAQARSELSVAQAARESLSEADATQAAARSAKEEALRAEPIGMNRQPVMDAGLSQLDDQSFDTVRLNARQRVDNLERMLDENPNLAEEDLAFKRDLIAAQDEFTASELEDFRRLIENGAPEDLAWQLRNLNLSLPDDKVKALLISDVISKRNLSDEMRPFMDEFASRSPDHAASLKGKLATVKQIIKEAGGAGSAEAGPATAQVTKQLDAKITQLESTVSTAEADLAVKAQASPVRGEVLENIRQELDAAPGGNPKELNAALGRAADERIAVTKRTPAEPLTEIAGSPVTVEEKAIGADSVLTIRAGESSLSFQIKNGALKVRTVKVAEALRGKGHGVSLYIEGLRQAQNRGLGFMSDRTISPSARRVYAALEKRGIKFNRITQLKQEGFALSAKEVQALDLGKAQRFGTEATKTAAVPPRVGIASNHLELTSADATRFRTAVTNGDFEEASAALANTFDRRNYNRMSSPEGLKDIIAGLGHEFAQNEKSFRMTYERSLDATERMAKNDLERFAKEVDGNPEAIAARFKELFPDLELDRALTGYRMFEAGLAKKLDDTADLLAVNPGDKLAQEEFARLTILLANVNDHLSGVTSAFGRAQSSGRIEVSFEGIDRLLDVQRKAFMDDIDKAIEAAGGSDAILKAAESVQLQGTRRAKLRQLRQTVERQSNTIGDVGYAFTATNMLSAFPTHTTNVIGPFAKTMIFDPAAGISAGGINWATGGGSAQLARELHFFRAKWRALTGAFSLDSAVRQASPLRAGIRRAFREGQRVTAPNGNTILGPGERNSLRAIELARTFKAGLPIHKPFSGFSAGGPSRVRLLGSSKFGPKMGKALEAQAEGNLRLFGKPTGNAAKDIGIGYGAAAKFIDFAGRIQSWPRHMIAAGDELVAGLNYRAKLEADAYAEASARGLTGQAHLDFVNDTIDNAARWMDIAKGVDPKDPDALARVEFLQTMDKSANNYVDEAAFSQPPGKVTEEFLRVQRLFPALRWFTFFARTGANIARVGWNTSLLGSGQQLYNAKTREEASLAAAKVAINTAIVLKTFEALSEGHLTGSGPMNKAERDVWLETHEPYSFWVQSLNDGKGGWVSYARLDPFATQIQVIAEFADALSYTDDAEGIGIAQEISERMGRLIGSKTYFQGISDFFSLLGGQRSVADVGLALVKDFVPQSALLRNIRRAGVGGAGADPVRPMIDEGQGYEINDAGELVPRREGWVAKLATQAGSTIQSEMPGPLQDDWADLTNRILDLKLDRRAYPQRDFFGNVMTYPPAFGPDNFSGLVQTPGKEPDPVVAELIKQDIGFNIKERLGVIRGVELTPEQMDYFHRQFANPKGGVPLHDLLAQRIADPRYQAAGSNVPGVTAKARRKKLLDKWITKREKEAEKATFDKFPALRAQIAANAAVADQMNTQEGSAAVKAEIDARKSAVLKALQEKLE